MNGHAADHHKLLHFFANKELNELYISYSIRDLGASIIGIFIPFYLLDIGFTISQVFFFFAFENIFHVLSAIPVGQFSARYGYKHAVLLSGPLLVLVLLMIYTIPQFGWSLILIALMSGIKNSLFFIGTRMDISKFGNINKLGSQMGVMRIIGTLTAVVGPFVGGVLITYFGFKLVFFLSSMLIMFSSVPLFMTKELYDKPRKFNVLDIVRGHSWKDIISISARGMETAFVLVWYVFIFTELLNNYATLGSVVSTSFVFALLTTFIIGRITNNHSKAVLRVGSVLSCIGWLLRAFVTTTTQVFSVDAFMKSIKSLVIVSFETRTYTKAKKDTSLARYILFREIVFNSARSLVFIFLGFFTLYKASFIAAAFLSLLYFFF